MEYAPAACAAFVSAAPSSTIPSKFGCAQRKAAASGESARWSAAGVVTPRSRGTSRTSKDPAAA